LFIANVFIAKLQIFKKSIYKVNNFIQKSKGTNFKHLIFNVLLCSAFALKYIEIHFKL